MPENLPPPAGPGLAVFLILHADSFEIGLNRLARPWNAGRWRSVAEPGDLTEVASGSYLRDMRAVGLKVLKNRLSEYVRLAAGGEIVLVTDRDRVVAELVPPGANRGPVIADALLADAVRQGWMRPPVHVPDGLPPRLLVRLAGDRGDR